LEEIDINALKNDKEFLENVKMLESEVEQTDSLAKIYQLLDLYLAFEESEDKINELFNRVVSGSFEILSSKLEALENIDLSNPDEWAAARGAYEHAIALFSENQNKNAQELFLALHFLIAEPKIKEAMMMHAAAIEAGFNFDSFMDKVALIQNRDFSDPQAVFITDFQKDIKDFQNEANALTKVLDKLVEAQKEL